MTKNTCRLSARGRGQSGARGGGMGSITNDDPKALQALRAAEVLGAVAMLRSAARRWSADWSAAEDLLQDTLERAFRTLDSYRQGTSAGAWMRTIMYRLAVDESRRKRRERHVRHSVARQSSLAVEPMEHAEEAVEPPTPTPAELGAAARQLCEPFRTAFDMWANQRMSYLQNQPSAGGAGGHRGHAPHAGPTPAALGAGGRRGGRAAPAPSEVVEGSLPEGVHQGWAGPAVAAGGAELTNRSPPPVTAVAAAHPA